MENVVISEKPKPPQNLRISHIGKDNVTLDWKPSFDDGGSTVKRYYIQVRSDKKTSNWQDVGSVEAYKTNFTVPDLSTSESYFFAVTAENAVGVSEPRVTEKPISLKQVISKYN